MFWVFSGENVLNYVFFRQFIANFKVRSFPLFWMDWRLNFYSEHSQSMYWFFIINFRYKALPSRELLRGSFKNSLGNIIGLMGYITRVVFLSIPLLGNWEWSVRADYHHHLLAVKNLEFWENFQPPSCVTCHMSCVIYIFFSLQNGGASLWRVCYQRGLPRLV